MIFTKIGTDVRTPQSKNEFVGVNIAPPLPLFYPLFYICLKCTRMAEIFASYRKLGSRNTTVTSDFRPEVEIWPCYACAMKNMQYNPYLCPDRQNYRVLQEIGVEEHDGDLRF